jgi:hypothetical protein
MISRDSDADIQARATDICQLGHRKRAEPVSQRALPDYQTEYLFLCLNDAPPPA